MAECHLCKGITSNDNLIRITVTEIARIIGVELITQTYRGSIYCAVGLGQLALASDWAWGPIAYPAYCFNLHSVCSVFSSKGSLSKRALVES